MKYTIKGYSLYELGQRQNQEDSMFPQHRQIRDTDRLFILCDGMGGHEAGEVASQTVCEAMSKSVLALCPDAEGEFSDSVFLDALEDAYDALDGKDNGAVKKMGTTMTFLKLHAGGATVAHIGDSRVYHIRSGATQEDTQILFQTEDHSLVNDLVRAGQLTREEAAQSPQKNIITRAIQPNLERRPKADVHHISDLRAGDFFLLCSDGILEQMEDANLRYLFSESAGDDQRKVGLLQKVTEHNRDNHSAILVHILDVDGKSPAREKKNEKTVPQAVPEARPVEEKKPVAVQNPRRTEHPDTPIKVNSGGVLKKYLFLILIFALVCTAAYWFFHRYVEIDQERKQNKVEKYQSENQKENIENIANLLKNAPLS